MSHNKEDQKQTPAPKVSGAKDLSEKDLKGTKEYVAEAEKIAARREREDREQ